ncbi:MAG TPA: hypothetical protein VEE86_02770 [Thermoplasmata archaeon]|nr:hypothetical protein [Thermoplasmata archaeon]
MPTEPSTGAPRTVPRGRCRCGHYPTHHMVTRPVERSSNFRLDPGGPCAICGAENCRAYVPAGDAAKGN